MNRQLRVERNETWLLRALLVISLLLALAGIFELVLVVDNALDHAPICARSVAT